MDNKTTFNKGKVVYWINYVRFENSPNKRDGKLKAEQYCLDNFLNPADIQKFDSRTEANYYEYLLEKQRNGEISNLAHHYTIRIIPEFINANNETIPELTYEADFIYFDHEKNRRVIADIKGSEYFINEDFITKKKVFDYLMKDKSLYIEIVLFRNKQFITYKLGEKKKSQKLINKYRSENQELKTYKRKKEIAERKIAKEQARLTELRAKEKLTSVERKRLKELEEKYS